MIELVAPDEAYKDSYLAALREFQAEGRYKALVVADLTADFGAYVRRLRQPDDPTSLAPGRVPETVLWLVDGAVFIGRVSIRHTLTDALRLVGGHIGYDIRPSRRRQGWGTQILRLALPHARALGLARVLVTCDADNIGSQRIIERNGGRLENAVLVPGDPVEKRRYWIDLDAGHGRLGEER